MRDIHQKPSFLITIDTEGDNLWGKPTNITTNNAKFLPRFQKLCEKYSFKPTYLTNYEMAISPIFKDLGRKVIEEDTGEIGMHLHAWNSPPIYNLTKNDFKYHPYLIEYPKKIIRNKIEFLTKLLETNFKTKIFSHRAGRWSINETYIKLLIENGYLVDCSVTPYVTWKLVKGDPSQKGGTDYSFFPDHSYFIDPHSIKNSGDSTLLEIPVSIDLFKPFLHRVKSHFIGIPPIKKILDFLFPSVIWFRPDNNNFDQMLRILRDVLNNKKDYIEFIIHSSELMPGGSRRFKKEDDIRKLYKDLSGIFKIASKYFVGHTLKEYYEIKINEFSK